VDGTDNRHRCNHEPFASWLSRAPPGGNAQWIDVQACLPRESISQIRKVILLSILNDAIDCIGPLSDLGYAFIDYPQNTARRFFRKGQPRTHHVHIVEQGSAELRDHLAFREALRAHPDWRDQYAALKLALADRHRNDRAQYTASKTEFVRLILQAKLR